MSDYETIRLEPSQAEGGARILVLTLDRPEKFNAINQEMVDEIHHVLTSTRRELPAALVFTGAGGRAFAAGADISELIDRDASDAMAHINGGLFDAIARYPAPTLAAIEGYALGGGLELALACDLRLCSESSKLGQPEVALGILPGAGATYRLPALIGPSLAKELIFTGSRIRADRALAIGLVNRVVPEGEVLEATLEMASSISANSREAVVWSKAAIDQAFDTRDGGFAMMAQSVLFTSEDKHRRMRAFLQRKRKN